MGRDSSDAAAAAGGEKRVRGAEGGGAGQSRRVRGRASEEEDGHVKQEREEEEKGAGASSRSTPNGAVRQGGAGMKEEEEGMEEEPQAGEGAEPDTEDDEDDDEPLVAGAAHNAELDEQEDEEAFPYFSKLVLDNFQCHNKFTTPWNKKLNFVTGQNGTGKSALLQAMSIALGAKSADSARMSSLKEFVGPFNNKSIIQLTVMQPKDDMYRGKSLIGERFDQDPEIIIERTITKPAGGAGGVSSLRLLNSKKHVLSRSREDLQNILAHLGIQPDNPVQFLQQNHSKEFLQKSSPTSYFKYFFKTTGLEKQEEVINDTRQILSRIKDLYEAKVRENVIWIRDTYEPREKAHLATQDIRKQEDEYGQLIQLMAWTTVTAKEGEIEEHITQLNELKHEEEARKVKIAQKEERESELQVKLDEAKQRMQEIFAQSQSLVAEVNAAKEVCNKRGQETNKATRDLKQVESEGKKIEGDIARLRVEIADTQRKAAQERAKKSGRAVTDVPGLEDKHRGLEAAQRDQEEVAKGEQAKLDHAKGIFESADSEYKTANQRMQDARASFQAMDTQQNNPLAMLGADVPRVVQKFEQNRQVFGGSAPLGPLARYISIKEGHEMWSNGVCSNLASLATTFLVPNSEMQRKAEEMVRSVPGARVGSGRGQISIKIWSKDAERVCKESHIDCPSGMPSLLDVIQIKHENQGAQNIVHAFLVDTFKSNEIRMAKSFDQGTKYMSSQALKLRLPNGVGHNVKKEVYCYNDADRKVARRMFFKGSFPGSDYLQNATNIFTKDLSGAREERRALFQAAEKEERTKHQAAGVVKKDYDVAIKALQSVKKSLSSRFQEMKKLSDVIQKEKEKMEQEEPDDAIDVMYNTDDIEREIRAKQQDVEAVKGRARDQAQVVAGLKAHQDEAVKARDLILARSDDGSAEREQITAESRPIGQAMSKVASDIARYKQEVQNKVKQAEDKVLEIKRLNRVLEEMREAATQIGERIDTGKTTPEEANKAVLAKADKIASMKKKRQDKMSLADNFPKYVLLKKQRDLQTGKLVSYSTTFKKALKYRRVLFKACKKDRQLAFGCYFMKNLSQRAFTGAVSVNYITKEMMLRVTPGSHGKRAGQGEEVSVDRLSGGERSFTTLCMVLGLKEATNSPFLGMDEFDVFMDDANRAVSLDMLCKVLKLYPTQCIIISPHCMMIVSDTDPDIKKIKMMQRENGQQTLDP